MKTAGVVILLILAGGGCGRYAAPDRHLRSLLSPEDVVGNWRLTESTVKLVRANGATISDSVHPGLQISRDGTCYFASVVHRPEAIEYVEGTCTWKLEHDTTGDSNIRKRNALRLTILNEGTKRIEYLNFAGDHRGLTLWNYLGDPDLGQFIEYDRSEGTTYNPPLQPSGPGRAAG